MSVHLFAAMHSLVPPVCLSQARAMVNASHPHLQQHLYHIRYLIVIRICSTLVYMLTNYAHSDNTLPYKNTITSVTLENDGAKSYDRQADNKTKSRSNLRSGAFRRLPTFRLVGERR